MKLRIRHLTFLIYFAIFIILFALFSFIFFTQREHTAKIILNELTSQIGRTSYILSKNIHNIKDIKTLKATIDRISSSNDFISHIMIRDNNNILLETDPDYDSLPTYKDIYNNQKLGYYNTLKKQKAIESRIYFYEGKVRKKLYLDFFINHQELSKYFFGYSKFFLLSLIIVPFILFFIIYFLIYEKIIRPLETLRQYAYYQSKIPDKCSIKELEAIRASMVQTFDRLENERKELYKLARTDMLSGLANRNMLNELANRQIEDSRRNKKEFALLFIDLDHFKSVNDSLGHDIGDAFLKHIAGIIQEVVRINDVVARIGGDEFIVLINNYKNHLELIEILDRIQNCISAPHHVDVYHLRTTCSIGVALYPKDGADLVTLMKNSDIAMYQAKKDGRSCYHFFTEELNIKIQNEIKLNNDMKQALIDNEYELYYQPKVKIDTNEIVGAEALIRWISPKEGIISPDIFIPLAEENGFIIELGAWVLEDAIRQYILWAKDGIDINLSINIATKQLLSASFIKQYTNLMQIKEVDPKKIDIEITEYLFLDSSKENLEKLNLIHDLGSTISLDDFGTGYSSLSYLKDFPLDTLKIDKSFIDQYATKQGASFIETIVKMGETLNLKIIAEGAETKEQVEYLRKIGCEIYQGYYCTKPLPAKEFEIFYKNWQRGRDSNPR